MGSEDAWGRKTITSGHKWSHSRHSPHRCQPRKPSRVPVAAQCDQMMMRWTLSPFCTSVIMLQCDSSERDLNQSSLCLSSGLHSPLCIPSSHVILSPSPFQCPSLQFSSSLPPPPPSSIGAKCDRNSNNTPQLCTNSLSLLTVAPCHHLFCTYFAMQRLWNQTAAFLDDEAFWN